jgi:hypothetical protein
MDLCLMHGRLRRIALRGIAFGTLLREIVSGRRRLAVALLLAALGLRLGILRRPMRRRLRDWLRRLLIVRRLPSS